MPSTTGAGFLTKANDWLKTRINGIDIFDEHYEKEAQTNPFYALGSIFYLVWFIVMATGVILIMWYVPTKAGAFDSIHAITAEIPFGNIMRGVHKYGADAMIIAATMRMFRMFLAADYKPGKEFNIAIGLVTLLLAMYSGLTGYLLIWNQRAFWATKVFATFPTYMDQFPVMGDFYLPLVKSLHLGWNTAEFLLGGGGAITQNTITRFFSLHLAFSLIPLIFVELYFLKSQFKRVSIDWPKRIVIILMLVATSIMLPAAIGGRCNPDVTPLPILSDWYFLGLYQMYKYLEPVVATEITMVIPITVVLIPFIDVWVTGAEKNIWKRPLVLMTTIMAAACWVVFSLLIIVNIANIHHDPPYWRAFLWGTVDIGIIWQCVLFWMNNDFRKAGKDAFGAIVMGVIAASQAVVAFFYYFMAKTEMFFSPLCQAWMYGPMRVFMGDTAEKAETLVRANKEGLDYWYYQALLAKGGDVSGKEALLRFQEYGQQSSVFDWLFALVPTFIKEPGAAKAFLDPLMKGESYDIVAAVTQPINFVSFWKIQHPELDFTPLLSIPDIKYAGMIDFMLTNRYCFDYVTFVDRMGGQAPYPLIIPPLDMWGWMVPAVVTVVVCFVTAWRCHNVSKQQPAPPPKKVATPVS